MLDERSMANGLQEDRILFTALVEGPELKGKFTWHVECRANMDLALLLDNYSDTSGGLP